MYQVIIKNDSTGDVLLDEKTDVIIGALHRKDNKYSSFTYCICNAFTIGNAATSVVHEIETLMAMDRDAAIAFAESRADYLKRILEAPK